MKIKKLGLLAMLGSMSIVGLGAATWKFSGSSSQEFTAETVTVSGYELVGAVTLKNSAGNDPTFKFTVDKDSLTFDADIVPTYTATDADVSGVTLKYSVTWGSAYATYFTFSNDQNVTWVSGTKITAPTATWVSGKNPTTLALYNTMKSALQDATTGKITITFSATSANGNAGTKA